MKEEVPLKVSVMRFGKPMDNGDIMASGAIEPGNVSVSTHSSSCFDTASRDGSEKKPVGRADVQQEGETLVAVIDFAKDLRFPIEAYDFGLSYFVDEGEILKGTLTVTKARIASVSCSLVPVTELPDDS